jgi:hypothetical protein
MTTQPPAEVQVRCLMGCRTDTLHRLQAVLGGRPLYACSNKCGAPVREISDPESKTPAARRREQEEVRAWLKQCESPSAPPQLRTAADIKDAPRPKETKKTMPTTTAEPKFKRSPLQSAIEAAVSQVLEPLRAEIKELRAAIEDRDTEDLEQRLKDLEAKRSSSLESEIPELVNRAVIQMLATPAAAAPQPGAHGRRTRPTDTASAPSGEACKHKNFMRKCASCQAKHADKE